MSRPINRPTGPGHGTVLSAIDNMIWPLLKDNNTFTQLATALMGFGLCKLYVPILEEVDAAKLNESHAIVRLTKHLLYLTHQVCT